MSTLHLAIASASGLALGYATCAHFAHRTKLALKGKISDTESELEESNQELSKLRSELKALQSNNSEPKSSEKSGGKNKGKGKNKAKNKGKQGKRDKQEAELSQKLKTAEESLDANYREISQLKAEIKTLKENSGTNPEVQEELDKLKSVKADSEQLKEKFEEEKKALEAALSEAKSALAKVEEDLAKSRSTDEANQAQSSATEELSEAYLAALKDAGKDLSPILKTLIDHQGQDAALLADVNGIAIASSGNSETVDGVAAAAMVLTGIPKQLQGILPLQDNFSFSLQDGKHSIVGQSFESAGERIAVTSIGSQAPAQGAIAQTVESLDSALK